MSNGDREPDALDAYLDDLHRDGPDGARIPIFDDADGRTDAVILFLFQDPGKSGAKLVGGSGMVSRTNKDASARRFKRITEEVLDLPPKSLAVWNACPWEMDSVKTEAKSAQTGAKSAIRSGDWIPRLLRCFPDLRVVALMGGFAQSFTQDVYLAFDDPPIVLHGPHPSARGMMPRNTGFGREDYEEYLTRVVRQAAMLAGVEFKA